MLSFGIFPHYTLSKLYSLGKFKESLLYLNDVFIKLVISLCVFKLFELPFKLKYSHSNWGLLVAMTIYFLSPPPCDLITLAFGSILLELFV